MCLRRRSLAASSPTGRHFRTAGLFVAFPVTRSSYERASVSAEFRLDGNPSSIEVHHRGTPSRDIDFPARTGRSPGRPRCTCVSTASSTLTSTTRDQWRRHRIISVRPPLAHRLIDFRSADRLHQPVEWGALEAHDITSFSRLARANLLALPAGPKNRPKIPCTTHAPAMHRACPIPCTASSRSRACLHGLCGARTDRSGNFWWARFAPERRSSFPPDPGREPAAELPSPAERR